MSKSNKEPGSLSAATDMTVTLSSKPTVKLWNGRNKTDKHAGVVGFTGFSSLLNKLGQAIAQDDPYADYHFHQIEQAINTLGNDLDEISEDIEEHISRITTDAANLPTVTSVEPVVVPVRFSSPLAYQLVYKLIAADKLIVRLQQATHIGVIAPTKKSSTVSAIESKFRSIMNKPFAYKHTGVNRDHVASKAPQFRKALEEMGAIGDEYLIGTLRSDFAPLLPPSRIATIRQISSGSDSGSDMSINDELSAITETADRSLEASA